MPAAGAVGPTTVRSKTAHCIGPGFVEVARKRCRALFMSVLVGDVRPQQCIRVPQPQRPRSTRCHPQAARRLSRRPLHPADLPGGPGCDLCFSVELPVWYES